MLEVQFDTKDGTTSKVGRVRVELNLCDPLKPGQLIRIARKALWLDFRYERLPHFCYSCGLMGHYAMYCPTIPFTEAKMEGKEKMAFSHWLRAEVNQHSPYWKTFYEGSPLSDDTDDVLPKTPPFLTSQVPTLPPTEVVTSKADYQVVAKIRKVITTDKIPVSSKQKGIQTVYHEKEKYPEFSNG